MSAKMLLGGLCSVACGVAAAVFVFGPATAKTIPSTNQAAMLQVSDKYKPNVVEPFLYSGNKPLRRLTKDRAPEPSGGPAHPFLRYDAGVQNVRGEDAIRALGKLLRRSDLSSERRSEIEKALRIVRDEREQRQRAAAYSPSLSLSAVEEGKR